MSLFEELTGVSKLSPKAGEAEATFTPKLVKKIATMCDKDEAIWAGLSEGAKDWYNDMAKAVHEKTAPPSLEGYPAEVSAEASAEKRKAENAKAEEEPPKAAKPPKAEKTAKPPKAAKPPKTAKAEDGNGRHAREPGGIRAYREEWNKLVPQAQKLGIAAKPHSSEFENYTIAQKRLDWLKGKIAEKQQAPAE